MSSFVWTVLGLGAAVLVIGIAGGVLLMHLLLALAADRWED